MDSRGGTTGAERGMGGPEEGPAEDFEAGLPNRKRGEKGKKKY